MKKIFVLLAFGLLLFGCISTPNEPTNQTNNTITNDTITPGVLTAQVGDLVKVDYIGYLDDGTVFDTSLLSEAVTHNLAPKTSYEPLEFVIGEGMVISGFENAIIGMKVEQQKTVKIPPAEAYGEYSDELIIEFPPENIPENVTVGSQVQATNGAIGTVVYRDDTMVLVDFNHHLAGQNLTFTIYLREIVR